MFPNDTDNARLPVLSSKQGWQEVFVSSVRSGDPQTPVCIVSSLIKKFDEENCANIFFNNFTTHAKKLFQYIY